jgi:hypothetical protein
MEAGQNQRVSSLVKLIKLIQDLEAKGRNNAQGGERHSGRKMSDQETGGMSSDHRGQTYVIKPRGRGRPSKNKEGPV